MGGIFVDVGSKTVRLKSGRHVALTDINNTPRIACVPNDIYAISDDLL
jgi:hypothetical protein